MQPLFDEGKLGRFLYMLNGGFVFYAKKSPRNSSAQTDCTGIDLAYAIHKTENRSYLARLFAVNIIRWKMISTIATATTSASSSVTDSDQLA